MKRLFIILMASALVLVSSVGCSTQPAASSATSSNIASPSSSTPAASGSTDKITYLIHSSILPDVHRKFIEEQGLGDRVEIIEVPYNQYESTLRTMCAGGNIPDVFAVDGPNIASYVAMGVMEPLDSVWDPEDYKDLLEVSQQAMRYEGKIYASPLCESNTLLFYNKEMLKAEGIEPATNLDNAWTLDQLIENSKKLTKRDAAGNVEVYGLLPSMFTPNNSTEGNTYTQQPWLWSFGSDVISPDLSTTKGYIDSPQTKKVLQFWYDLHNTWKVSPNVEMTSPFEAEKVALWYQTAHIVGAWKNSMPEWYNSDKWGAMPAPKLDAGIVTGNGSWNLAMGKGTKNPELAWQVIETMTGAEGSKEFVQLWGRLPARKSVINALAIYNEQPWDIVKMQMVDTNTARMRYLTPVYPQISEATVEMFNSVALGEDIDVAIAQAGKKIEKAISK